MKGIVEGDAEREWPEKRRMERDEREETRFSKSDLGSKDFEKRFDRKDE